MQNHNNPKNTLIIEGVDMDAVYTNQSLADNNKDFLTVYNEYLECSVPNALFARDLSQNLILQTERVGVLENDKARKSIIYNTCNNKKIVCENILQSIETTQESIDKLYGEITKQYEIFKECRDDRIRCDKIKNEIASYEQFINSLTDYIKRNKYMYKKNLCDK